MISSDEMSLLRVAFPSNATAQQPPQYRATSYATSTQQPPLKPASLLDLARNKLRNNHATSSKKDAQQAHQKQGVVVSRLELINLVRFIADFHGFTAEEHDEALTIALADFDNALVCFRALKQDALSIGPSTRFKSAGNTLPLNRGKRT
jgi:hypothetical protein